MANVVKENIGAHHNKLVATLAKETYQPVFEKKIKEYAKTANVAGFRKGMVPVGVIKKMYGNGVLRDVVANEMNSAVADFVRDEKMDLIADPILVGTTLDSCDINNMGTHTLTLEVATAPKFDVDFTKQKFPYYKITLDKKTVDAEIMFQRKRLGTVVNKEKTNEELDRVEVSLVESDKDGLVVDGGLVVEKIVLVINTFAKHSVWMGRSVGDVVVFQPKDITEAEGKVAWTQQTALTETDAEKYFKATINAISIIEPAALDEKFFSTIKGVDPVPTNEDEYRAHVTSLIAQHFDTYKSQAQLEQTLYHFITAQQMDMPVNFLKKYWQQHYPEAKAEEIEKIYTETLPTFKWEIIRKQLEDKYKIEISKEEVYEAARLRLCQSIGMDPSQVGNMFDSHIAKSFENREELTKLISEVKAHKILQQIAREVKKDEKKISLEDFNEMQQKYNQEHHSAG